MVRSLSLNPSNVSININNLLFATIKGLAFGKNYREQPLKGPSWEVMLSETIEIMNGSIGDSFPWLGRFIDQFSRWNAKPNKRFNNLDAYIETIVDGHQNHTIKEISCDEKDFVHTLVKLSVTKNVSGYRLTKEDVKALVMDVIIGGIDTIVVILVWAMSEIVRNTKIMQKLQSEIRNCAGRKEKVHDLDITKMTYLKRQISWIVVDGKMRDKMEASIVNKLVPMYEEFYGNHLLTLSEDEQCIKMLIRLSPEIW
ncbi:cytochrome P450 71B34-like protein [Tanacetum coccineum]